MKTLFLFSAAMAGCLLGATAASAQQLAKDAERYAKTLQTDKDPERRAQAARDLAGVAAVKVAYVRPHTAVLLEAFQRDSDTQVRVAAGTALLAFQPESKDLVPAVLALLQNEKEPGAVLGVAARLAAAHQAKDAIPALQALKQREEAKDDPKLRDQRLLQAVKQSLQVLTK
ncbi:hypothetical protein AYO44_10435 [Planctomycetaceae bacterium SCGC AG-212-F19]|nr:hypothetical protein AYO44_10435 [Planctomycetaceae bacterium SCGC AG-212-F19]